MDRERERERERQRQRDRETLTKFSEDKDNDETVFVIIVATDVVHQLLGRQRRIIKPVVRGIRRRVHGNVATDPESDVVWQAVVINVGRAKDEVGLRNVLDSCGHRQLPAAVGDSVHKSVVDDDAESTH